MSDIDYDALTVANKVLVILTIVFIVFINGILIIKIVRKPKFFQSPKLMLLISLAIVDIFHGFFSLVINALILFEDINLTHCPTLITGRFYHDVDISFLYGVGVVFLALELVVRHKCRSTLLSKRKGLIALIFCFVPGILALIFVLPFTISAFDWDECTYRYSKTRIQAMYSLCYIVLPILAFIASIVILFIKLNPQSESFGDQRNVDRGVGIGKSLGFSPSEQQGSQQPLKSASTSENSLHRQSDDLDYNDIPLEDYSTNESEVYAATTQPIFTNDVSLLSNPVHEKRVLLFVAISLLVCVVPFGASSLSDVSLPMFTGTLVQNNLFWLFNVRSILAPFIWLVAL
jgi:hypothetical protein